MPLQYARLNAFRLNNSRLNYLKIPKPLTGIWLWVGGAWVDYSAQARIANATITQALNEVADTATVRFAGEVGQPLKGQRIKFTQTNPYTDPVLFAGHILNVRTVIEGKASHVAYDCDCIDYTWTLTFKKVTKRYVGQTAAQIITDLIASFAPQHTVTIAPAVPTTTLDEITFTNEDLAQAISRVCERLGLYWLVDYYLVVQVFTSAALSSAGTVTPTNCRTIQTLTKAEDLSPIANSIYARGGGSAATVDLPAGSITLPIDDPIWYARGGGYAECGPQLLYYADVVNLGTGALVGSGNAPSAAPTVAAASGSNLALGALYQYAVSFVTSAGETLVGPVMPYTPIGATIPAAPAPAAPGDIRDTGNPAYGQNKMVNGGSYRWAWEKYISGGGKVPGTPSAPITVNNTHQWQVRIPNELYDANVKGLTLYRTANGGSTFYADYQTLMGTPGSGSGWITTGQSPDGDLVQFPPMSGGGASMLAAVLTQLPIYPKAGVATARKIYRTTANGLQLKLLATIADNTTVSFVDTIADAALGATAPITDTSGIQSGGQINAGVGAVLVSNVTVFSPNGGWVTVGGLVLQFTGVSGSSILLAAPLPSTLSYGSEIINAPYLTGIPPSGNLYAIRYPIKSGDEVFVVTGRDDQPAIANLAAWVGYGDGVRIEYLTDGRLSLQELNARADALLAYRKDPLVTISFTTRDPAVTVGKTITFNLTAPPIVGTFLIQRVQISDLPSKAHVTPVPALRTVEASSRRFTFDDLVQQIKLVGRIN